MNDSSEERTLGGSQPTIAITLGDPAGIGPEVILKALATPDIAPLARWMIVGDRPTIERTGREIGIPFDSLTASGSQPGGQPDAQPDPQPHGQPGGQPIGIQHVGIHHVDALNGHRVVNGQMHASSGAAAVAYVKEATEQCLRGDADAMVTAPISKEAVALGGTHFSGHTEYIAELCGVTDSRMMLFNTRLSVVHVTTHIALRKAVDATPARIVRTIALAHEAMGRLGLERPRIAVCGMNPHASEHGLFGTEEDDAVRPAMNAAREQGIACEGPFPPDTIFLDAWRGKWDVVIAMYHDQGHIPMKLLDFANTVNVTLGIPIVRTSVDHGTAFDIAGRNLADPTSMKAALRLAARMVRRRTKGTSSS
jgi:4-phospho-D-threonate 3-dehydrogenase / 4-phospho-D-erythronate 3-dehydrogenase